MVVMSRSVTLISGALKNVGDFLIFNKAKELITHFLKPSKTVEYRRTDDFRDYVDSINNTDALFICGGPGYRKLFYPYVYKFLEYYDEITTPVIPYGLGWQGLPRYLPKRFKFSPMSEVYIRRIHEKIPVSTTRDEITKEVVGRIGVNNVINTGCPTLFEFDKMANSQPFHKPTSIENLVVSMAQDPHLHEQNVDLLRALAELFPDANKYALFHRGIGADEQTTKSEGEVLRRLVSKSSDAGFEIIDLSYDLNQMQLYKDSDIHVGYRVHGHAFSVSHRIPTFLLWEDGRGQGMSGNLGLEGVPAFKTKNLDRVPRPRRFDRYINFAETKLPFLNPYPLNDNAVKRIVDLVQGQIASNFKAFDQVPETLDVLYSRMKQFFSTIDEFLNA
jgi:hypothetical protein